MKTGFVASVTLSAGIWVGLLGVSSHDAGAQTGAPAASASAAPAAPRVDAHVPPTTQPAAAPRPALAVAGSPRVEVFSFLPISAAPQTAWIGRAIQESLQSSIGGTGATLIIPAHPLAAGEDQLAFARQNKADLAVVGSYQVVGDDVRVNGYLMNTATGETAGSFAATGPQKNLFALEDALGEQLRRLLPASANAQQIARIFDQSQAAQPTPPAATPDNNQPPVVNNYYDTLPLPYDEYDPGYAYVYPYDYYPFGFYGGVYGGGYFHDHGFYGRGSGRGFTGRPFVGGGGFHGGGAGFLGRGGGGGGLHGGRR